MVNKEEFLKSKGWHTWYHPNYWVHTKLVTNPAAQDYTNYGMSLDAAYSHEVNSAPPFKGAFMGLRW